MRYFKLLLNIFIPLFHNLLFLLNQIGGFEGTHCSCSSVLFRVLILSRWLQRYLRDYEEKSVNMIFYDKNER